MDNTEDAREAGLAKPFTPARLQIMLVALMLSMMLIAWIEGAIGPLLGPLQAYWHVNDSALGLIFSAGFAGTLFSGLTNVWIAEKLGFGYAAPLGALLMAIASFGQGTGGSFESFLLCTMLAGFGGGIQDANANNIASRLPSGSTGLFLVQASFSLGATIAPLVSTPFAQRLADRPYLFFLVVGAVAVVTALIMLVAFGGATEAQMRSGEAGQGQGVVKTANYGATEGPTSVASAAGNVPVIRTAVEDVETAEAAHLLSPTTQEDDSGSWKKLARIFRSPQVWAILLWDFFYCGAEVAVSSFLTPFLIRERGGTAAAGYATVAFWAAATVGRAVSAPLSRGLGYKTTVYLLSLLSVAASVFIALNHSFMANAAAFACIGFLYGPLYPCALMVVSECLDDDLRGGIIGLMGTAGGAGSALLPLAVGFVSDRYGIASLQASVCAMMLVSLVCWVGAPRRKL